MKSILMVGQSNMAGRGFLTAVPPIVNENLSMFRNGRWQLMAEPVNFDREVAGVGPAPDGPLLRHAIQEAQFAQETSDIIAILWHQGENDSHDHLYQTYPQQLTATLTHLRTALKLPHVPIILGELPDFLGQQGFGLSAVEAPQINAAIHQVATALPQAYVATATGLTSNPDGIHLDAPSQRRFGYRYYQAFQTQADVTVPAAQEATQVAQLTQSTPTPAERQYLASKRFAQGQGTFADFIAAYQADQEDPA
ncbi:sialate O-acetylesterase [Levilactobacillus spicheri]